MTREEEIKKYCEEQGFPYGACSGISSVKSIVATEAIKWADNTMIEKSVSYIKGNVFKYMPFVAESVKEKIINDFKEAMKL